MTPTKKQGANTEYPHPEDRCDYVTDSDEHVQVSLMGAIGGIIDEDTNMCANDYSVDSESEIYSLQNDVWSL